MWKHHNERYQEIEGIAGVMGIKTQRLIAVSYIYEMASYCSSLVARDDDGIVMMFRNLDFSAPELLKKSSFVGEFYKGGKKLHTTVVTGSLVTATGFKENGFAISFNQRNPTRNRDFASFFSNFGFASNNAVQVSALIR